MEFGIGLMELGVAAIVLIGVVIAVVTLELRGEEEGAGEKAIEDVEARFAREELQRQLASLAAAQNELSGRLHQLAETASATQAATAQAQTTLAQKLEERLSDLGSKVSQHLADGAEKTHATLNDLSARLALIDEAQKTITTLSKDVVGLQDILSNKQARGAFGEVQLEDIVRMALAPDAFGFQVTLSNKARADCLIRLPSPPGPIAVDAKFPLESYAALRAASDEAQRQAAQRQFRIDVMRHATAIKDRYIIEGETADSALMFLPSEAIYAELHANFVDVVQKCHGLRVYAVSPTTLMATLHSIRAILKDARMHEQAHVIQREVAKLAEDAVRLRDRALKLEQHFQQTERDVHEVVVSSEKISRWAERIGNVDLGPQDGAQLTLESLPDITDAQQARLRAGNG